MAFADELVPAFDDGIEPGVVQDCGLRIVRLDRVEHNELVNDLMLAEIRRCQFLVADVTLHRTGVYFEAGFALGLGRTVIWCCRNGSKLEEHFDTRQYPHIIWTTPQELRQRLRDRIRGTVQIPVHESRETKES
jgi:nucleoside 2-deoxyribosyltransferase